MANQDRQSPGLVGRRRSEDILKRVMRLSEADETEAILSAADEALTRFAHNVIHQNVAEVDATLEVRAAFGTRVGIASTNDLSPAGIERVTRQAGEMARHLPENPDWPGFPDPRPLPEVTAYDESVASMTPELRARLVADVCRAAR